MYFYLWVNLTMNANIIIFFAVIVQASLVMAHSCLLHKTCGECITDSNVCVWCASGDPKYDKEARCRPEGSHDKTWCSGSLDIPDKPSRNPSKNINFSSTSGDADVVQIKPQQYDVKLRPGLPLDFAFSFQGAKDYPVDLYMLLDASDTMTTIRDTLAEHSENIYKTMQSMTENVYLGFGTFVDKNTPPFTLEVTKNRAYSFRNMLNLTEEYNTFKKVVASVEFGKNVDEPEGGLDALAQVMACNVGWRENSRKIIVFLTDSSQHVVGDGRSAGILKPYDGECHTYADGIYTKELEMDYPSLTTINRLALDNEVIIIFTLINDKISTFFMNLKDVIRGSKVAVLNNNNIVEQLEASYKEISTNIKLEVEVQSGHRKNYEITFSPDCTKEKHSDDCKIETEQTRDFTGTITLNDYYGQDTEVIEISVQGMKEKLTLNVTVIKCNCEAHEVHHPDHCSGQKFQCGICFCDKSSYGNQCMCKKDTVKDEADNSHCIAPSAKGSELCSGKGECECGLCTKCDEKDVNSFGRFCECDLRNCPKNEDGAVCGGHGKCSCSEGAGRKETCSCDRGWKHKPGAEKLGCVCPDTTDSCISKPDNTVCNQRGECVCDSCVCDPIAQWDKRTEQDSLCRLKPTHDRHSLQCNVVRTCVLCHMNANNCNKECDGIVLEKRYDVLPKEYLNSTEWSLCDNQKVDTGCYTMFVYKYDDGAYRILMQMQDETDCAQNYYMYGGILLATLLLVGIFTILIWKLFTYIQDRREYAKFEAEHKNELNIPCQNPLYDGPTTHFRNPAFKKSFSN